VVAHHLSKKIRSVDRVIKNPSRYGGFRNLVRLIVWASTMRCVSATLASLHLQKGKKELPVMVDLFATTRPSRYRKLMPGHRISDTGVVFGGNARKAVS
jgi:hypothetical protein